MLVGGARGEGMPLRGGGYRGFSREDAGKDRGGVDLELVGRLGCGMLSQSRKENAWTVLHMVLRQGEEGGWVRGRAWRVHMRGGDE